MPRVRPTEASWDSDDDLTGHIAGIDAFPDLKKSDTEEELDEDALLGLSDGQLEQTTDQDDGNDDQLLDEEECFTGNQATDDLGKEEELDGAEPDWPANEKQEGVVEEEEDLEEGDVIDISVNADIEDTLYEETLQGEQEVSFSGYGTQSTVEDTGMEPLDEPQIPEDSGQEVTEVTAKAQTHDQEGQEFSYTETETTQNESKLDEEDEDEDEDSEDEGEDKRRGRFKSERSSTVTVSSTKDRSNIPDTLEISEEEQAKIDEFMTKGKPGKHRHQQRGGLRHGGPGRGLTPGHLRYSPPQRLHGPSHMSRDMLHPRIPSGAPSQAPAPTCLATTAVSQLGSPQQQSSMGNRPRKILINPHFKGTVQAGPDVRLLYNAGPRPQQSQQPQSHFQSSVSNPPLFSSPTTTPVQSYPSMQPLPTSMVPVQRAPAPHQIPGHQPGLLQVPSRQPMPAWTGSSVSQNVAPPNSQAPPQHMTPHNMGLRPPLGQAQNQGPPLQQGFQQTPFVSHGGPIPQQPQQQFAGPRLQPMSHQVGPTQSRPMHPVLHNQRCRGPASMPSQPQFNGPRQFHQGPGGYQQSAPQYNQAPPSSLFQQRPLNQVRGQFQPRPNRPQHWQSRPYVPSSQGFQSRSSLDAQPIQSLVSGQVQQPTRHQAPPRHPHGIPRQQHPRQQPPRQQPPRQVSPRFPQKRPPFRPRQGEGQGQRSQFQQHANPQRNREMPAKKRQSLGGGDMGGNVVEQAPANKGAAPSVVPCGDDCRNDGAKRCTNLNRIEKTMDPETLELQKKLEAQKRLREEVKKRKELRRQLMSGKGREQLEQKSALTGKSLDEIAPAPPGQVLAVVKAMATKSLATKAKNIAIQRSVQNKISTMNKQQQGHSQGYGQGQTAVQRNKLSVKQRLGKRLTSVEGRTPAMPSSVQTSNLKTIPLQDNVASANTNNSNSVFNRSNNNNNNRQVLGSGTERPNPNTTRTVMAAPKTAPAANLRTVVKPGGGTGVVKRQGEAHLGEGGPPKKVQKVLPGDSGFQRVVKPVGSGRVRIDNLAKTTNQACIKSLCEACGPVEGLDLQQSRGIAIVKFANPANAVKFLKRHNQRMIELSKVNVSLLPN